MSRDTILSRIRAITDRTDSPATPRPAFVPPSLVSSGAEALSRFHSKATAKGVIVVPVESYAALPFAVANVLSGCGLVERTVQANDPAFAALPWSEWGVTVASGPAQPGDGVALSHGLAAIAETGTVMLASGADNPTTLAFLPETHLVAIDRSTVIGTFEEAIGILRRTYGTKLPRSVNFISGASRTGDIGGRIVHGAHGPRRLVVFILSNAIRVPRRAP